MSLKRPFVPKSDVKQRFTTTGQQLCGYMRLSVECRHSDAVVISELLYITILSQASSPQKSTFSRHFIAQYNKHYAVYIVIYICYIFGNCVIYLM